MSQPPKGISTGSAYPCAQYTDRYTDRQTDRQTDRHRHSSTKREKRNEPWGSQRRVDKSVTSWHTTVPPIRDPIHRRRSQGPGHLLFPGLPPAVRQRSACGPASSPCWSGTPARRRPAPFDRRRRRSPGCSTRRQQAVVHTIPTWRQSLCITHQNCILWCTVNSSLTDFMHENSNPAYDPLITGPPTHSVEGGRLATSSSSVGVWRL